MPTPINSHALLSSRHHTFVGRAACVSHLVIEVPPELAAPEAEDDWRWRARRERETPRAASALRMRRMVLSLAQSADMVKVVGGGRALMPLLPESQAVLFA